MINEADNDPILKINSEQAFTPDPVYKMMGIFEDSEAGVAATQDLVDAGFDAKDVELFCGVPGAATYDFSGEDHGPLAAFLRKFRNITFDRVILERYEAALNDGHCVLTLYIHKTERRQEAADVLHHNGAAQVDYFGLAATRAYAARPNASEDKYDPEATF